MKEHFRYDALGRPVWKKDRDGNETATAYTRTDSGHPLRRRDRRGNAVRRPEQTHKGQRQPRDDKHQKRPHRQDHSHYRPQRTDRVLRMGKNRTAPAHHLPGRTADRIHLRQPAETDRHVHQEAGRRDTA